MEIYLEDVIECLEKENNDTYFYLPSEELAYIEDGHIYFSDSNRTEDISEINNGEYLRLPNRDYVDMYEVMEEFIAEVDDEEIQGWLANAIRGKGAFRMFRSTISRFNIEDYWQDFKYYKLREYAIDWCLENGLEYYELEDNKEEIKEEKKEEKIKQEEQYRLFEIKESNKHLLINVVMEFRNYLNNLNGYDRNAEEKDVKEEIDYYLDNNYPIYAISINGLVVGYCVIKIIDDVVWLESLYVRKDHRNKGIGEALFNKAQDIAYEHQNDTLYINVHPNNDIMFSFLRKMNYDILNLIEVRKAYKNEILNEEYEIGNNSFKYRGKENG